MADEEANSGFTYERSADGGTTWTSIPRVRGPVLPEVSPTYRDITDLDGNGWRVFFRTLLEASEFTLECTFTEAGYAAWLADQAAGETDYRVTSPGGRTWEFIAFATPTVQASDIEGEAMISVSMRPTGALTQTAPV